MGKRKISILTIVLTVILTLFNLITVTAQQTFEPDVKVSSITYSSVSILDPSYDAAQHNISVIPASSTIYMSASIKNYADTPQPVILAAQLLKGGVRQAFDMVSDSISAGGIKILEVSINTPSDVSGLKVETIVWESFKTMRPLASPAYMPSNNKDIATITIDGNAFYFEEAQTEVEYTIPVTQLRAPDVKVVPMDNSTKVTVTLPESFPGSTVIKMVALNGEEDTYTIKYKCDDSFLSDFTILIANDDRKNSSDVSDRNDTAGTPSADNSELGGGLAVGNPIYEFSGTYPYTSEITEVNSDFAGCEYIKMDSSFNHMHIGALHGAEDGDWVSFKAERPIRVYLAEAHEIGVNGDWNLKRPIKGTWLTNDGWTVADTSATGVIFKGISYAPGLGASYPVTYGANRTIYKDFEAGVTVTLKTQGDNGTPYIPIIQTSYAN